MHPVLFNSFSELLCSSTISKPNRSVKEVLYSGLFSRGKTFLNFTHL